MSKKIDQDELVEQGFHRLDDDLLPGRPPKIKWGKGYQEMSKDDKIDYLQKLATSMNHAASLIQTERDTIGKLCEAKEAQIVQMKKALDDNNAMIQSEVTRMNTQRQDAASTVMRLNQEIRKMRNGNND